MDRRSFYFYALKKPPLRKSEGFKRKEKINMQILPQGQQPRLRLVPRITNDDCIFCHGAGELFTIHGDEEFSSSCQACEGTGKDDPELYLIMSGNLVPPVFEVEL